MLCELTDVTVVLESLALIVLIRMFVLMKALMVLYLSIIPSLCWWKLIYTQIAVFYGAFRHEFKDILCATSQVLS